MNTDEEGSRDGRHAYLCLSVFICGYCHARSPSTIAIICDRFFSNRANSARIIRPSTIPATYQSHVQPRLTDAFQIIAPTARARKLVPRNRKGRMRYMTPTSTPATDRAASTSGSQGEAVL